MVLFDLPEQNETASDQPSHTAFHTGTGETQHLHPQPGLGLNQASSLVAIGGMGCQGMIQSIGPASKCTMVGQEKLSK